MATTQQELQEKILACGEYHLQLVSGIAELDHASPSLETHQTHLADLKKRLATSKKKLQDKERATLWPSMEHKDLSKSRVRRFFGKEKFEKRVEEAARKLHEAVQAETQARETRDELQKLYDDALAEEASLKEKIKKHKALKSDQLALFSQLFDGPTPVFPQEDQLEESVKELRKQRLATEKTLGEETKATDILEKANATMNTAASNIQDAITFSMMDIAQRGGGNPDLAKRTWLKHTTRNVNEAKALVQKAIAACPRVQPMPEVTIAGKSYWSDVFFDNVSSDVAFHSKIKESAGHVQTAQQKVRQEYATAAVRKQLATEVLKAITTELESREKLLFDLRKAIIDSVLGASARVHVQVVHSNQPIAYAG
ncbi:hypothetical protein BKA70DRAFT_1246438 [Coprinopsis sp. MPI-PUGE-AT-0042]|nr:hypothetical protein BKA70DRAFT_1246438 [Coprinopsis sp. MPI-PUGE-AT-0042]